VAVAVELVLLAERDLAVLEEALEVLGNLLLLAE
jgi:hypothetical protein